MQQQNKFIIEDWAPRVEEDESALRKSKTSRKGRKMILDLEESPKSVTESEAARKKEEDM